MKKVMIRYNTENTTDLYWRVIFNGEEKLYNKVNLYCISETTQDNLPDGRVKFHITAHPDEMVEHGKTLNLLGNGR